MDENTKVDFQISYIKTFVNAENLDLFQKTLFLPNLNETPQWRAQRGTLFPVTFGTLRLNRLRISLGKHFKGEVTHRCHK